MPRPRPPHLHAERSRHGRLAWYVRIGKGKRTRLHAEYGTPEFYEEYHAAITAQPRRTSGAATGTLRWLLERYRESAEWRALSHATRRQRENIFLQVLETAGDQPYSKITQGTIIAGRDRRASTPAQARNFLDAMRGIFRWALAAQHVRNDPTAGVKNPKRKKGRGFPAWTEADAAAYEQRWPIGTKERVWYDVLCFTGARRGDAVIVGRQHVRDNVLTFRTEKGGEEVEVTIPILPALARTLEAGPCGDLAFICGAKGRPLTKESFGNAFSDAARAAGVQKSAHGVRKIAATRAADNGATVHQLMAIFGWRSPAMAQVYTQEANRRRLAMEATHKLAAEPKKDEAAN
jgi:site-specific recombinase XerD